MELTINAKVSCTDGEAGHLNGIILKPDSDEVTHIVVKWHHKEYVVQASDIASATPVHVQLTCTCAELEVMPPFVETEYVRTLVEDHEFLPEGYYFTETPSMRTYTVTHEHIPEGELEFTKGTHVYAKDGKVGHIEELVVNPLNFQITDIVLREGPLSAWKELVVGVEYIKSIEEDGLHLKLNKAELKMLPPVSQQRNLRVRLN